MEESKPEDKITFIEIFNGFNNWVKKNWFTVVAIFIILGITIYDVATVQTEKTKLLKQCNEYWFNQVERVCPVLSNQPNAAFEYNLSIK